VERLARGATILLQRLLSWFRKGHGEPTSTVGNVLAMSLGACAHVTWLICFHIAGRSKECLGPEDVRRRPGLSGI